jgi:hypothetical protein
MKRKIEDRMLGWGRDGSGDRGNVGFCEAVPLKNLIDTSDPEVTLSNLSLLFSYRYEATLLHVDGKSTETFVVSNVQETSSVPEPRASAISNNTPNNNKDNKNLDINIARARPGRLQENEKGSNGRWGKSKS